MAHDFAMEMKLITEAPSLHRIFSDNVLCAQNMLLKYKSVFPSYTDHTSLHSLEVIAFCNELIGDYLSQLNTDEIFILLMASYLHDSGMGITEKDYFEFCEQLPQVKNYISQHAGANISEVVRIFHHEFSGCYIEKYKMLFDFPSEEHLFAVIQVSRGHRKTDLYDENEYPGEYILPNGNVVHLPYLAALIRLADELDIAADRNIQFLYDINDVAIKESYMEFKKHTAIKEVNFEKDCFTVRVEYDKENEPNMKDELQKLFDKLKITLDECVDVTKKRTPFEIKQTEISVVGL